MADIDVDKIKIRKNTSNGKKESFLKSFAQAHPEISMDYVNRLKDGSKMSVSRQLVIGLLSVLVFWGSLFVALTSGKPIIENVATSMGVPSPLLAVLVALTLYFVADAVIDYGRRRKLKPIMSQLDEHLKAAGISPPVRKNVLLAAMPTRTSRSAYAGGGGSGYGGAGVGGGGGGG